MPNRCRLIPIATIALACAVTVTRSAWSADTPVLMMLAPLGAAVEIKVEAKPGAALSPARGGEFEKWKLRPGSTLVAKARPEDGLVEFYRGADIERVLLCSIGIRYFRDDRGLWVPHYQLNQEAIVIRDNGGRWQPLTAVHGAPSLIVLTSTTLPNAEGFYPSLEFGLTNGRLQIDSWVVR